MTRRAAAQAGFTLLETMVALAVFALVMAGLQQGVQYALVADLRQDRRSTETGRMAAVDRQLRLMIEGLDPQRPVTGEAHSLRLHGPLPHLAPIGEADLLLDRGQDGSLRLRWIGPGPASHVLTREDVLLRDLAGLDLAYWPRAAPSAWVSDWHEDRPPALVRLRLIFRPGDARHWPDIVAAPVRDLVGG